MLFGDMVFGPVKSRRLGRSLGVNLLPVDGKLCNFDCIYCECGWTDAPDKPLRFNDRGVIAEALEARLRAMSEAGEGLDVITFAGNGEPTMHPHFAEIVDDTVALRDRLFPSAKVAVLSNATMIGRESVRKALERVDRAILKIDSAFPETIRIVNGPRFDYSLDKVIEWMNRFEGDIVVQTMFLRGEKDGIVIDNTTDEEVSAWLDVLDRVRPSQVMIYSIDRATPHDRLAKVSGDELERIAERVRARGYRCDHTV
ncbi:MAG: radical SAM protein [Rikenellaceae bacterium]|nr:radical SAM protein [Rikenellaceae bacterium]